MRALGIVLYTLLFSPKTREHNNARRGWDKQLCNPPGGKLLTSSEDGVKSRLSCVSFLPQSRMLMHIQ